MHLSFMGSRREAGERTAKRPPAVRPLMQPERSAGYVSRLEAPGRDRWPLDCTSSARRKLACCTASLAALLCSLNNG